LSWDFNVGGWGFFCIKCFICFLLMMRLHCYSVFNNSFCYLSVGFLKCLEFVFSQEVMYFFVVIIWIYNYGNFTFISFNSYCISRYKLWFKFFTIYACRSCVTLEWLLELKICFSFLAATIRNGFWIFMSKSLMACPVSIIRLIQYVFNGFSMLLCNQWSKKAISSWENLIFVKFTVLG
jgi:hypothetical protein